MRMREMCPVTALQENLCDLALGVVRESVKWHGPEMDLVRQMERVTLVGG
jgi:hypothetical protein